MENKFIMTAFGKDRPGIVAQVTKVIFDNKCNLDDSNMSRLADEFTLILLLSGKSDDIQEKLTKECERLESEKNIFVSIRPLDYSIAKLKQKYSSCTIEVEGVDQAGIVYKISRLLAENNINIETLKSQRNFSPNTGTALYSMAINIKMPEDVPPESISMEVLEDKLEELAEQLHVDINIPV